MGKLIEGIYHYEYILSAQVVTYLHFSSDPKIKIKSKSTVNDGNSADVSCLSIRVQVLKDNGSGISRHPIWSYASCATKMAAYVNDIIFSCNLVTGLYLYAKVMQCWLTGTKNHTCNYEK